MSQDSSPWRFSPRHLIVVGLLACSIRAEPDLRCPDYVASYAPLIWLHSDDRYKPSDLLTHIRHTTPELDGKPISGLPTLNLDNLDILNKHGDDVALTSVDDPITHPDWFLGEAPDDAGRIRNSTPCVVIIVEKTKLDLDAFYFYFYSYNEGPNITQVLEPLDRLLRGSKAASGMHFGNHVGDWEHNMVRFKNGKPIGIYYSQHVDGMAYDWNDRAVSKSDGRPVVYSARGSHANYPEPGDQVHNAALIDYCNEGQRWDPVLSAYFYRFDPASFTVTALAAPGQEHEPSPSSPAHPTSFFYFTGMWGDMQYPDSDPRQETTPYFGLKRFPSGPTGPRHKHLVRKGLKPDPRRRLDWAEWGVRIYMSLYPCCLKGWRAWVSLGLVVAVVVVGILGIRLGIKRYRTSEYKKLDTEDVPLDDWQWEEDASSLSEEQ